VALVISGLWENTVIGCGALGRKGLSSEALARSCTREFLQDAGSSATLDIHMADQVLAYLTFASGRSVFAVRRLTGHTQTNMEVLRLLTGATFEVDGPVVRITPSSRPSSEGA